MTIRPDVSYQYVASRTQPYELCLHWLVGHQAMCLALSVSHDLCE